MSARICSTAVVFVTAGLLIPVAPVAQSELPMLGRATEAGWQAYVRATEDRLTREAAVDLPVAQPGTTRVSKVDPPAGPDARPLDVRDAWVHHWRGAVLLPGVTLDELMARLERNVPDAPDVLSSTILKRDGPQLTVFLRVQRQQTVAGVFTVTFVYDTVHAVTLSRATRTRASSAIRATRIAEVDQAGTRRERILPPGEDHAFLWRWHSYWRYQQINGGVMAQCESVSLSRTAPLLARLVADSVAASAATDAMTQALISLRDWMAPARTPRAWSRVQSMWR